MENYNYTPSTTTHHHPSPPPTPITISDPTNPYPTTFIQADTTTFKTVVQLLTGSPQTTTTTTAAVPPPKNPIPPIKTGLNKKPSNSKLYERRSNSQKNSFKLSPLVSGFNPNSPEILSPSILDFTALVLLSPVTPLSGEMFDKSPAVDDGGGGGGGLDVEAEEKAIAEKGFYLHPSPASTPEPRLLELFPVNSIRVSGGLSS